MRHQAAIEYYMRLARNLQLPVVRFTVDTIPEYDLGLRASLGLDPRAILPYEINVREQTLYFLQDDFFWRYALVRLPDEGGFLLTGPYLTSAVSEPVIMACMERNRIPAQLLAHMRSYYDQLRVIHNESPLIIALSTLGEMLWDSPDNFSIKTLVLNTGIGFHEEGGSLFLSQGDEGQRKMLEERYEGERRLLYAIAHGHVHQANMILNSFDLSYVEQRAADPLRNIKNYAIVCSTLMRKAVQQAGVHPLYIDRLSSKTAFQIEQVKTVAEGVDLLKRMAHKYCLLVKNHNTHQYSQPVQSVILRTDTELAGDLSLKAHAAHIGVNASYLSALFKKETGLTLTDYVTHRRVDYAIFLLNSTDMQIQTIAQHCGIPDVNYFTRSFRRIIGVTPSEYRARVKSGES